MIINNDKLREAILVALADKEMLKILDAAMVRARPVNDIIKETGVAHTTAYRKVNWLLHEGLLSVQSIQITPEGKKFSEVRSTLKSFNVKYEFGNVIIEGEQNFNPIERTANDFFSIRPS